MLVCILVFWACLLFPGRKFMGVLMLCEYVFISCINFDCVLEGSYYLWY